MSSSAQIAANRANAQKSTGPRTEAGKQNSRFNAFKHGADAASVVVPGEDPAEYDALVEDYHREFNPTTALEQFQVDTIIRADWQRRRLKRIENNLYRALLAEGATPEEIDLDILSGSPTAKLWRRVTGMIAGFERGHHRAVRELRRIARDREEQAAEAGAPADAPIKLASIPAGQALSLPGNAPPTPTTRDLNLALRL